VADFLYALGPPLFVAAYVRRFEPVYDSFKTMSTRLFHRGLYGTLALVTLLMLVASTSSISRRWDIDVDPEDDMSQLSKFENRTFIFFGLIVMLINLLTTGMGVRFIIQKLKKLFLIARIQSYQPVEDPFNQKQYFYYTFIFLILNFLTCIIFVLTSLGVLIPNWILVPLILKSQILSLIVLIYFSFMMLAMMMFEKTIQARRCHGGQTPMGGF
jgi:hypothetical protein